jgi:hypothetical protein
LITCCKNSARELERKFSTENKATGYFIFVVIYVYLKAVLDGVIVDGIEIQSLKRNVQMSHG